MDNPLIKVCPECGAINSCSSFNCEYCENELDTIKPTRDPVSTASELNEPVSSGKIYRQCRACGFRHYVEDSDQWIRKCSQCGDLRIMDAPIMIIGSKQESDIPQSETSDTENILYLDFEVMHSGYIIRIPLAGGIIGRNGEIDVQYFNRFPRISAIHCKIKPGNHQWLVEDLERGHGNGTYLNQEELLLHTDYPLKDGYILRIADVKLRVMLKAAYDD